MICLKMLYVISIMVGICHGKQICYDSYGCFIDTAPFGGTPQRPSAFLPDLPTKIETKFTLYNRKVRNGEEITGNQPGTFNATLQTKIFVHGFINNALKDFIFEIKDVLLKKVNLNVVVTDWSKGNGLPYNQATANTQIVGIDIANLISSLISNNEAKKDDFHCIGLGLGAHICGYAGKRISGLGQITGLDPAGPYFENTDPIVRLDKTDANFVDIIHTDGSSNNELGLGLMQSIGHVDFFPNGGKNQPSCPQTSDNLLSVLFQAASLGLGGITKDTACNHMAAVLFYIDSLQNTCKYTAYPCKSKEEFDNGNCLKCSSPNGCNRMGYFSSQSKDLGDLYLKTQSPVSLPYCLQHFRVSLLSTSSLSQARGKFTIILQTRDQTSTTEVLDDNKTIFKKGSEQVRDIILTEPMEDPELTSIFITFNKATSLLSSWLYESKWAFDKVEVFSGDNQKSYIFCPSKPFLEEGQLTRFNRC